MTAGALPGRDLAHQVRGQIMSKSINDQFVIEISNAMRSLATSHYGRALVCSVSVDAGGFQLAVRLTGEDLTFDVHYRMGILIACSSNGSTATVKQEVAGFERNSAEANAHLILRTLLWMVPR